MAFQTTLPPSLVAKMAKSEEDDGDGPKKKSREDWRKMKELEEMRKAGTAPAMQDEEGKDINPHIPQYIMQAPWYYGTTAATLKHQRPQDDKQKKFSEMDEWFKKGTQESRTSTKYRKGACENCGAMTHKKKDCLERPRKLGAKYTGENFAADEFVQPQLSFDFDGKRDRWNGYDPTLHQQEVQEEFARIEEAKRLLKEKNLEDEIQNEDGDVQKKATGDSDDDDELKYAEDMEMPGQKFETKQRITVRNLRIREDTAKYLYNLDTNSAFYDPKTRSMRDNPMEKSAKDAGKSTYFGDNMVRGSGGANDFAKMQLFAWDAYERGTDVHIQSDPTKTALLSKEFEQRTDYFKTNKKQTILDKYGGKEHLNVLPKELLIAQTENYVEYSKHGSVIKGQEKSVIRSKYEEDVYFNNHTQVWGSFWKDGQWGYKCCHALVKESYCAGNTARDANDSSIIPIEEANKKIEIFKRPADPSSEEEVKPKKNKKKKKKNRKKKMRKLKTDDSDSSSDEDSDEERKKKKRKHKHKKRSTSSSDSSESDEEKKKVKRLKEAMKKEGERQKEIDRLMQLDERKRPYNSMYDAKAPSEEEVEAFRMKQKLFDDPMSHF